MGFFLRIGENDNGWVDTGARGVEAGRCGGSHRACREGGRSVRSRAFDHGGLLE